LISRYFVSANHVHGHCYDAVGRILATVKQVVGSVAYFLLVLSHLIKYLNCHGMDF